MTPERAALTAVLDQLLDAHQVAELLEVGSDSTVRAYASVRADFPRPVLPRDPDTKPRSTQYWWRPDIVAWREKNPPRARSDSPVTPDP